MTYFKLFNIDQSFQIDPKKLSMMYKELQKRLHPDMFSNKSETEQELAEQQSSLLNKAYFTLLKPLSRALYLLELHGYEIEEGTTDINPEFLMEILDLNERIGESNTEDIEEIEKEIANKIEENTERLSAAFAADDLEKAQEIAVRLKYYVNVESKVKAFYRDRMVSKLWKHQIEIVLRQRRQYYWELFESEGGKNHVAVLSSVEQFILDLPVCPSLILVLSTDKLWKKKYSSSSDSGHAHSSHHKKKQTLAERLAAIVPPRCKIICSSTYGIIGTSSNLARTKEIEHSEAVAVLCFGLHPGLEFVPIDLNPVLFRDKLESLDFNRSDTEQAIQREDFG
nr:hypothetical protein BaRGS_033754 [Batillaria attramentaria]